MCCNLLWMKYHLQYDVTFTFSRIEHHVILLARCEAGWMKYFSGDSVGAGNKSSGRQIPRIHAPSFFALDATHR